MPTYDYVCTKCNSTVEVFQRISDPPKRQCPKCRGRLRRQIGSGAGLIFRGSGFYITDYRSESYKRAAKAEKESPASAAKGESSTKGEAAKKAS